MNIKSISATTYRRLCIQGYGRYSAAELASLHFGIRLPYVLCTLIAATGLALANIPILTALMVIAFLGVILPYHPFDYLYNFGFRYVLRLPPLPPRTAQVKFACGIATVWLGMTVVLFWYGLFTLGVAWGSVLIVIAGLVSITDICIPSMIYNWLTRHTQRSGSF